MQTIISAASGAAADLKLKDGDEVKFGEYVTFMKVEGGGWTSGSTRWAPLDPVIFMEGVIGPSINGRKSNFGLPGGKFHPRTKWIYGPLTYNWFLGPHLVSMLDGGPQLGYAFQPPLGTPPPIETRVS